MSQVEAPPGALTRRRAPGVVLSAGMTPKGSDNEYVPEPDSVPLDVVPDITACCSSSCPDIVTKEPNK